MSQRDSFGKVVLCTTLGRGMNCLTYSRTNGLLDCCRDFIRRGWPKGTWFVQRETVRRNHVLSTHIVSYAASRGSNRMRVLTVAVLRWTLGKECVRSHQGEMSTPPAGIGRPVSRRTCNRAMHNPPPAESPATTMCAGLTGR